MVRHCCIAPLLFPSSLHPSAPNASTTSIDLSRDWPKRNPVILGFDRDGHQSLPLSRSHEYVHVRWVCRERGCEGKDVLRWGIRWWPYFRRVKCHWKGPKWAHPGSRNDYLVRIELSIWFSPLLSLHQVNIDVLWGDLFEIKGDSDSPGSRALCKGIELIHNELINVSYLP